MSTAAATAKLTVIPSKSKRSSSRRNYNNYTTFINKILHQQGCGATKELRRALDSIIKQLIKEIRRSIEDLMQKSFDTTGLQQKRVVIRDATAAVDLCFPFELRKDIDTSAKRAISIFGKAEGDFQTKIHLTGIALPMKRIRKAINKSCNTVALIYIVASVDFFLKYTIALAKAQMLSKVKRGAAAAAVSKAAKEEESSHVRHRISLEHLDRAVQNDTTLRSFFGMYTIPQMDPELNIHVYKAAPTTVTNLSQ